MHFLVLQRLKFFTSPFHFLMHFLAFTTQLSRIDSFFFLKCKFYLEFVSFKFIGCGWVVTKNGI
jgi:hypothetical protein